MAEDNQEGFVSEEDMDTEEELRDDDEEYVL